MDRMDRDALRQYYVGQILASGIFEAPKHIRTWKDHYAESIYSLATALCDREKPITASSAPTNGANMSEKTTPRDVVLSGIKDGATQAATDELSEVLLRVFDRMLGGKAPDFFETPVGRELAKGFIAAAVMTASDHFDLPVSKEAVRKCAKLQVQTATMRILQPHIGELRRAAMALMKHGTPADGDAD